MINSEALTVGISVLANGIASGLSDEDLALLATIFAQLGDTLATIAAHRVFSESIEKNNNSND